MCIASWSLKYGERFRVLRKTRWHGTVLALAIKLEYTHPGSVYTIERAWRVPMLTTIDKHAAALGCEPWELLENVETEYDLTRALAHEDLKSARREWRALLDRYLESVRRGGRSGEERSPTKERRQVRARTRSLG